MGKDKVAYLKHHKVKDRADYIVILLIPLDFLHFISVALEAGKWIWSFHNNCKLYGSTKSKNVWPNRLSRKINTIEFGKSIRYKFYKILFCPS